MANAENAPNGRFFKGLDYGKPAFEVFRLDSPREKTRAIAERVYHFLWQHSETGLFQSAA